MKTHLCKENPLQKKGKAYWAEGPVAECPFHERNRTIRRAYIDKAAARQIDREAGVRGVDRGSFISGT